MCCHQTIDHATYPFSLRSNHRFWTKRLKICSKKIRDRKRIKHEGFLQLNVHCPQKRWWLEAHNQSQVPQCLPGSLALQDEGHKQPERCIAGRRLHGKDRPGRCLPFNASSSETSRLPKILLETKYIPVQIPPIRPGYCTKSFYKDSAAPFSNDEKTGTRIIVYLDNILVMAQTVETLKSHMQTLDRELQALGFKLNHKKCVWEAVQAIKLLGFLVNSKTMKIYLPEEKIQKVTKECRHTINKRSVTARHLAHLRGLLSSTAPALSVAFLHCRDL